MAQLALTSEGDARESVIAATAVASIVPAWLSRTSSSIRLLKKAQDVESFPAACADTIADDGLIAGACSAAGTAVGRGSARNTVPEPPGRRNSPAPIPAPTNRTAPKLRATVRHALGGAG